MYIQSNSYNVPMALLIPSYTTVNGVRKKTFPTIANGIQFFGTFKTYGGTERTVNGVYSVEDTATVETWFRNDFAANCRIALLQNNAVYEIISAPENIEMRNKICVFKVRRVTGGA